MNWQIKSLDEVCIKITDGAHQSPKTVDSGKPMASVKDLTRFGVDLREARKISVEDFERLVRQGCQPQVGDVLIAKDGNSALDTVCNIKQPLEAVLLSSVAILRPNFSVLDSDFLKFYLSSKDVVDYFKSNFISGAAIPRVVLRDFRKAQIYLPELKTQKQIAKILSDLDDKIHLNNQINQTLESIAQAIFKSWFIDFDPVRAKIAAKQEGKDPELAAMCAISGKTQAELDQLTKEDFAELQATAALFPDELVESELGEVPRAWAIGELKDLIDFNPKRTLKKDSLALYLDMKNVPTQGHLVDEVIWRNMSSGTKFINGDTLLARITPCLENGKTAYVDFLSNNEVGWGSTEFIVLRPRDPLPVSLGYFLARQDNFRTLAIQSMTGTSGRQRANADNLANQLWLIYPKRLLIEFDKYSGKYLKKAKINGQQNRVLKSLRDTLLPKLLSGEMDMLLLRQEGA